MVWMCAVGNSSGIIVIVIFVYVILYQIIGIVLAIQTRKVKVKVLNDSKYVAALVYVTTIMWIATGVVTFVLPWNTINIMELIFSGSLLLGNTAIICLTFIPKV